MVILMPCALKLGPVLWLLASRMHFWGWPWGNLYSPRDCRAILAVMSPLLNAPGSGCPWLFWRNSLWQYARTSRIHPFPNICFFLELGSGAVGASSLRSFFGSAMEIMDLFLFPFLFPWGPGCHDQWRFGRGFLFSLRPHSLSSPPEPLDDFPPQAGFILHFLGKGGYP